MIRVTEWLLPPPPFSPHALVRPTYAWRVLRVGVWCRIMSVCRNISIIVYSLFTCTVESLVRAVQSPHPRNTEKAHYAVAYYIFGVYVAVSAPEHMFVCECVLLLLCAPPKVCVYKWVWWNKIKHLVGFAGSSLLFCRILFDQRARTHTRKLSACKCVYRFVYMLISLCLYVYNIYVYVCIL